MINGILLGLSSSNPLKFFPINSLTLMYPLSVICNVFWLQQKLHIPPQKLHTSSLRGMKEDLDLVE